MKINTKILVDWVAALRSGNHEQMFGSLHCGNKYCALGLGYKVAFGDDKVLEYNSFAFQKQVLPDTTTNSYLDVFQEFIRRIVNRNDVHRMTFPEIADYIVSEVKRLYNIDLDDEVLHQRDLPVEVNLSKPLQQSSISQEWSALAEPVQS